ncbi:MAG: molecular chaperone HtpG [Vicinamibacterales bacterium]
MTVHTETREFQAETRQLLNIVIHSLYSHKEIFLRELVSNASDAIDRLRFEALSTPGLVDADGATEIVLEVDKTARTLTVSDTGIGMSRDEVIAHLGTIAKSGTRELVERLKAASNAESMASLIGQFGVGFYSAFMVADTVTVVTRRAGEATATRWESSGDGTYTISDDARFRAGTSVTLRLKPVDAENGLADFTDEATLTRLVKKHSDFVSHPIRLGSGPALNSRTPIWTRPPGEVTAEEYAEFYRHVAHDWQEPLERLSLKAEGRLEYQALLFVPTAAPFDLYYRDQEYGLRLYVRRVLVMDRCRALLPSYLRFVKGVVDSTDLPLNISREMIQQDRHIAQMRAWITRKILDHLHDLSTRDRTRYETCWREFGNVIKEGVGADPEHRDRLTKLLLFPSSHDPAAWTSLAEYVSRMKDGQQEIFYLTGESRAVVEHSPHLEAFKAKGYEVLYLVEPVDEFLAQTLPEFEGKRLHSAAKGDVALGDEAERAAAEERRKDQVPQFNDLLRYLERTLESSVKEARLSSRLTSSPACLVGDERDLSPGLERLLRRTAPGEFPETSKRILEVNPEHDLITRMRERLTARPADPVLAEYAELLLGYALLSEGSSLPDPARFSALVAGVMARGLTG